MKIEDESTGNNATSYLSISAKYLLIGLICGAVIAGTVVAIVQFGEFFSSGYEGLGPSEFKFFGYTIRGAKRREVALLSTFKIAQLGAIAGAIIGLAVGFVKAFMQHRRVHL